MHLPPSSPLAESSRARHTCGVFLSKNSPKQSRYNYGVFLSEHNDKGKLLPQARDVLQQAIALEPSHLDALELVASVHQMLKDGPAAERALRSAIELQDVDDPCRVELVASYIQLLATWPGQERYSDAAELLYR